MRKIIFVTVVAMFITIIVSNVRAAVLNFNDLEQAGTTNVIISSYSAQGFEITSDSNSFGYWQQSSSLYESTASLFQNHFGEVTKLSYGVDRESFDIVSIDLDLFVDNTLLSPMPVTFMGYDRDGTLVDTTTFMVKSQPGWETFTFPTTFTSLAYVEWAQAEIDTPRAHQFDNILLNVTSVPETNILYGIEKEVTGTNLFTIDITTGETNIVGSLGGVSFDGGGLSFDENGNLYGLNNHGNLYSIATCCGSATLIGNIGITWLIPSCFAIINGKGYTLSSGGNCLYEIDLSTGRAISISIECLDLPSILGLTSDYNGALIGLRLDVHARESEIIKFDSSDASVIDTISIPGDNFWASLAFAEEYLYSIPFVTAASNDPTALIRIHPTTGTTDVLFSDLHLPHVSALTGLNVASKPPKPPTQCGEPLTFTTIDFPGSNGTNALDINDFGDIVGSYSGQTNGFLLSGGIYTTINPSVNAVISVATGINNNGVIVGYFNDIAAVLDGMQGFLFDGTTYTILNYPEATATQINGINDNGVIVGRWVENGITGHGFSYDGITWTSIDFPGADGSLNGTWAGDINNLGQIVGTYHHLTPGPGANSFGFILDGGAYTQLDSGGDRTEFVGINNTGLMVGVSSSVSDTLFSGLKYDGSTYCTFDIPDTTGTTAMGVNDLGSTVGVYSDSSGPHGFVTPAIDVDADDDGVYDIYDNCPLIGNADQEDNDGDGDGDVCDPDDDNDGVLDTGDNCQFTANSEQEDNDQDTIGDICDPDDDNDDVSDTQDNCPFDANADQSDTDGDGLGDICDDDPDGDGVFSDDNCPLNPNPLQEDNDDDDIGDVCDDDDDNDGVIDIEDNCPTVANDDQADLDQDNIGDACDSDIDGDGINNEVDNCQVVSNVGQEDTDYDENGDACDDDDDNDSVLDINDNCSLMFNEDQIDSDNDGRGDVCDDDLDGDGVDNEIDNCKYIANSNQNDWNDDFEGDACDDDIDGDGVPNDADQCEFTPLGTVIDPATGCSIEQLSPCKGPRGTTNTWKNHGKYMSSVAKSSNSFRKQGLITEEEKAAIMSEAANSSCGQ